VVWRIPALGSRLDSARAKITRANAHLRALKHSLDRFGQRDRYVVGIEEFKSDVMVRQFSTITPLAVSSRRTSGGLILPGISEPQTQHLIRSLTLTITLTPKPEVAAFALR